MVRTEDGHVGKVISAISGSDWVRVSFEFEEDDNFKAGTQVASLLAEQLEFEDGER